MTQVGETLTADSINFEIIPSDDHEEIEKLARRWQKTAGTIDVTYWEYLKGHSDLPENSKIRKERAVFQDSYYITGRIAHLASLAKKDGKIAGEHQFFLWTTAEKIEGIARIQGIIVVEKNISQLRDCKDCLEISYLATNPRNITSTIVELTAPRIRGIASSSLKFVEETLAYPRKASVILESSETAKSFYEGRKYKLIGKENDRFVKRIDQIAQQVLNSNSSTTSSKDGIRAGA
jgi:hypothetical protein